MKKLTIAALFSIATAVAFVVVFSHVSLAVTGGFGGKPAHPDPKVPRSNDIFVYTLKASERRPDEVLISNNTDVTQTIQFYATDAEISNTGAFTCKQRVEPKNSVGKWISFEKNTVTLESGTNIKVPFSVRMPESVAPGEHNGCLAFESKGDDGEVEGNVRIRTRSAVRVAITVPGNLDRNVDITSFAVTKTQAGQQEFTLSVKNTGNVSADTKTAVDLKTIFGASVYHNEGVYPVLAGNKYDVNYINEKKPFWGGWYEAVATISYSDKADSFGIDASSELINKEAAHVRVFMTPAPAAFVIYLVLLILVVLIVLYLALRRHELHKVQREWKSHIVKEGETIQTLSQEYNVSWKKLAKINNVQAPYILQVGSSLRVPKKK